MRKQVTPDSPLGPCIPMSPEKRWRKKVKSEEILEIFPMITHSLCFSSCAPTFSETWKSFGCIGTLHTGIAQDQTHPTSGKQDLAFHAGIVQHWASCISSAWDQTLYNIRVKLALHSFSSSINQLHLSHCQLPLVVISTPNLCILRAKE